MAATVAAVGAVAIARAVATGAWPPPEAVLFVGAILGGVAAALDAMLRGEAVPLPATETTMPSTRLRHLRRESAALSDADRALAAALVAGATAQVVHEQEMVKARGQEPVVVRLVPRIPARPHETVGSWLGGGPGLPDGMAWPEQNGTPLTFLAQLDCAALPADVWDGLGPRNGALLIFCHPETAAPMVLHVTTPGTALPNRGAEDACFFYPRSASREDSGPDPIRAFPRSPVDLVAVRPGDDDPRAAGEGDDRHALYENGYDLTDPAHQPFDWNTTLAMLDVLERKIAYFWRPVPVGSDMLGDQLKNAVKALEEAEAQPQAPANLARLRHRVADLPILIDLVAEARAANDTVKAALQPIIAEARERAAHVPFSAAEVEAIVTKLAALTWFKTLRLADEARGEGAERFEQVRLPLTRHDKRASLWVHDFELIRADRARHAYADRPDRLPVPVRSFYETQWQVRAGHEMAGLGHVPFRFVHEFDDATEVTLLELPSSTLLGWMWGDVDDLVLTMRKADLAAGALDRVTMQVTN